ncbi:type II secretion system F family protein [Nocardioides acrostichi]|uniref:Type II secretion system F family protein n=1 Tax=Nocardioides acrostichi TaxID=2784339 RepID=A0A930UYP9_9ACTN|nr:type II secretion system F family protein [Nocardioides acrostichi]MBF4160562.1 type II secretion system F family protein [Nocardioides acrostichi]
MLLVLAVLLVAVALLLVAMATASDAQASGIGRSIAVLQAMTNAPKELVSDVDRPFDQRVLEPLKARALSIGRRLSGADTSDRLRRKLDLAGNPAGWTVDRVVSTKVIAAVVGLVVGFVFSLLFGSGIGMRLVLAVGGLALGFMSPNLWLYQRAYDRTQRMQRELPDAIDLMTISVESGLGFDAAVQQVARNTEGPLSEEFSRMLREMQLGKGRAEALRSLSERSDLEDLHTFVGAMVQADAFGVPVGQVLRVQSGEMRVKRRQRAETKAQQVPVKITVPLIFCILPCLFIAVMGPAALTIMDNM